jgi:hypothetical protein
MPFEVPGAHDPFLAASGFEQAELEQPRAAVRDGGDRWSCCRPSGRSTRATTISNPRAPSRRSVVGGAHGDELDGHPRLVLGWEQPRRSGGHSSSNTVCPRTRDISGSRGGVRTLANLAPRRCAQPRQSAADATFARMLLSIMRSAALARSASMCATASEGTVTSKWRM